MVGGAVAATVARVVAGAVTVVGASVVGGIVVAGTVVGASVVTTGRVSVVSTCPTTETGVSSSSPPAAAAIRTRATAAPAVHFAHLGQPRMAVRALFSPFPLGSYGSTGRGAGPRDRAVFGVQPGAVGIGPRIVGAAGITSVGLPAAGAVGGGGAS